MVYCDVMMQFAITLFCDDFDVRHGCCWGILILIKIGQDKRFKKIVLHRGAQIQFITLNQLNLSVHTRV